MAILTAAGRRRVIRLDGRTLNGAQAAGRRLLMNIVELTDGDGGARIASVAQLGAGMAHAFNNHLSAVIGSIDLAMASAGENAELLAEAEAGARRAMALANRLGTFAAGGAPVKAAVPLAELVQRVARSAQGVPSVAVDLVTSPQLWDVEGDDRQLHQALEELVANACDAMPDGGALHISASNVPTDGGDAGGSSPGPRVRVDVEDEGPGIPASSRARIFEPFFTTKHDRVGLGLAIVASVAHRHGGTVDVLSRLGGGTTFSVSLPARPAAAAGRSAAARGADGEGLRILVMDDQPAILQLTRRILSQAGHEADLAADGEEAIVAYRGAMRSGCPYHLVILDLNVAIGMGGVDTLARLQAIDPGVRAIVCSGYSDEPVMAEPRRFGFSAVVRKPYTSSELIAAVAEVAGSSASVTGPV
jgi:CheY-like chemotaxis protein